MRESLLQKLCIQHVRTVSGGRLMALNIHGSGYSNKGLPDLLIFGHGRCVAVELKADSGYKVQPEQRIWATRFTRCGIHHHVIDDLPTFKRMIREEFPDETR